MKKVLVVDDTKNIRMILTKCLELEGYEVTTASDGKLALDLLMTDRFDLAFLDIKLPEVRGTEILKNIRERGINTPVIIITAYATVKNAVDCTNMGAVAYVQKPFSADKIKTVLKELGSNPRYTEQAKSSFNNLIKDAKAFLDNGAYDKALVLTQKVLSMELNNPEVYLLISKAYKGLGETENAERFYNFYKSFMR